MKEAGDASASDRMRIVAAKYKNLDEKVKTAFLSKLSEVSPTSYCPLNLDLCDSIYLSIVQQEAKRFEELQKKFLDNLPEARKPDYEFHIKRKSSKRSSSPAKKSKKPSKKKSKSKEKSNSSEKSNSKIEPGQQQIVIVDLEPSGGEESEKASAKRKAPAATNSNSVKQLKLKMFKS